jgi:alpha-glucuronidase
MRRRGIRSRDLTRVRAYALLLAACGINAVAVNNVNVHTNKAHLLTDRLDEVAALADRFHPYGIRTHLSVDFASPITLGGLASAHPLAAEVRAWWDEATRRVYELIPDFGGYVVKADSEGRPGPFAYGRSVTIHLYGDLGQSARVIGGIHGVPCIARRSASNAVRPCLRALER